MLTDIDSSGLDGHQTPAATRRQTTVRLAALSSRGHAEARDRPSPRGGPVTIERPLPPRALLNEVERVFGRPQPARRDCWRRQLYEEWVSRLGAERMHGFLIALRNQFTALSHLALDGGHDALHRLAHDVASTSGMLGFLEVTRCCRAVLESDAASERQARDTLQTAIDDAIDCLDHHLATERGVLAG